MAQEQLLFSKAFKKKNKCESIKKSVVKCPSRVPGTQGALFRPFFSEQQLKTDVQFAMIKNRQKEQIFTLYYNYIQPNIQDVCILGNVNPVVEPFKHI